MPNIRIYNSQVDAESTLPGATAQASDFGGRGMEQLGAAVETAGGHVGEAQRIIYQNKARREVTDVDMNIAKASMALTQEMAQRERTWNPDDQGPNLTEVMQSRVKDTLDKLNTDAEGNSSFETAYGKRHFDNRAATLSSQFLVESTRIQSNLDGQKAKNDHVKLVSDMSAHLYQEPGHFQSTVQALADTVNNPHGIYAAALNKPERVKLIQDGSAKLAESAVEGTIRQFPLNALADLKAGWMDKFLSGDRLNALRSQAEVGVHALDVDGDRAHKQAEWDRQEAARASETTLFKKMALYDAGAPGAKPLSAQDVLDSGLMKADPVKAGALLGVIKARANEKLNGRKGDDDLTAQLYSRMFLPADNPKRISSITPFNEAYGKKGSELSMHQLDWLITRFTNGRSADGAKIEPVMAKHLQDMKSSITNSNILLGKLDQDGDINFGRYREFVTQSVTDAVKEGRNPHDLFKSSSPSYLGNPLILARFQKSLQQSQQTIVNKYVPKPAMPHMDGESTEDYLARRKKAGQ